MTRFSNSGDIACIISHYRRDFSCCNFDTCGVERRNGGDYTDVSYNLRSCYRHRHCRNVPLGREFGMTLTTVSILKMLEDWTECGVDGLTLTQVEEYGYV